MRRILLLCTMLAALRFGPAQAEVAARVTIDSTPSGASVYVDGRETGLRGYSSPGFVVRLKPGTHKITLELEGYKTLEKTLYIDQGQKFSFRLDKAPAKLEVKAPATNSAAAGADVYVDGSQIGTVPAFAEVAEGRHLIEVKKAGYQAFSESLELKATEARAVWVSLVLLPEAKPERRPPERPLPPLPLPPLEPLPPPVMVAPAPPEPAGTRVFVRAKNPEAFTFGVALAGQTGVTPCEVVVPPGAVTLQVSGPRNFTQNLYIPPGTQEIVIQHRTTSRIIAGAILTPLSLPLLLEGGILAIAADNLGSRIVGIGVLAHGVAFFIAGIVELATIKRNRAVVRPLGQARLFPVGVEPLRAAAASASVPPLLTLRF